MVAYATGGILADKISQMMPLSASDSTWIEIRLRQACCQQGLLDYEYVRPPAIEKRLNMTTAAMWNLLATPGPERRTEIEAMIVAEFRAALQIEPDEPLPMDTPYFELGFTSLRLVETGKRLEQLLGVTISSNVLFSRPTLAQLTAYLADEVLPAAIPSGEPASARTYLGPDTAERALLDTVLPELNQP
jgi:acyl carrier protein